MVESDINIDWKWREEFYFQLNRSIYLKTFRNTYITINTFSTKFLIPSHNNILYSFALNIPKRSILSIKLKLNDLSYFPKILSKITLVRYQSNTTFPNLLHLSKTNDDQPWNPGKHFSQLLVHERSSTRFLRYDVPLPNHHDLRCTLATMKRANSLMLL